MNTHVIEVKQKIPVEAQRLPIVWIVGGWKPEPSEDVVLLTEMGSFRTIEPEPVYCDLLQGPLHRQMLERYKKQKRMREWVVERIWAAELDLHYRMKEYEALVREQWLATRVPCRRKEKKDEVRELVSPQMAAQVERIVEARSLVAYLRDWSARLWNDIYLITHIWPSDDGVPLMRSSEVRMENPDGSDFFDVRYRIVAGLWWNETDTGKRDVQEAVRDFLSEDLEVVFSGSRRLEILACLEPEQEEQKHFAVKEKEWKLPEVVGLSDQMLVGLFDLTQK